ncbi:AAA family ATPase [Streptomyces anulatus]
MRQQRHGRILLDGPPGAGTTYTALALATSIGDRVAVIDAQRGRISAYAETFPFHICPPVSYFSPDTLVTMLAHCAAQGYDTVVIAPISAFWSDRAGVLDQVTKASKRGSAGNRSGWSEVRPMERHMLEAVLGYPGHVIATVRDKLEYVAEPDETGHVARRIIGMAPIGRDGMAYDWDFVATMDHSHTLVAVRAPGDLSGHVEQNPGAQLAARIKSWLDQGIPLTTPHDLAEEALRPDLTFEELGSLMNQARLRHAEGHPLLLPDGTGTTLGTYITRRGNELRSA